MILGLTGHMLPKYADQGILAGMDKVEAKPMYAQVVEKYLVDGGIL